MRTLIIFSILISFCTLLHAQERLSKVANLKAPVKAEKKSREEINMYEEQNFKSVPRMRRLQNLFKSGEVLIEFEDFEHPKSYRNTLEDVRARILGEGEEMLARGMNNKVDIQTINGTRYLFQKLSKNDEFYYYFRSEDINKKGIMGTVKFKTKDREEAEKVLHSFLNNVKFLK